MNSKDLLALQESSNEVPGYFSEKNNPPKLNLNLQPLEEQLRGQDISDSDEAISEEDSDLSNSSDMSVIDVADQEYQAYQDDLDLQKEEICNKCLQLIPEESSPVKESSLEEEPKQSELSLCLKDLFVVVREKLGIWKDFKNLDILEEDSNRRLSRVYDTREYVYIEKRRKLEKDSELPDEFFREMMACLTIIKQRDQGINSILQVDYEPEKFYAFTFQYHLGTLKDYLEMRVENFENKIDFDEVEFILSSIMNHINSLNEIGVFPQEIDIKNVILTHSFESIIINHEQTELLDLDSENENQELMKNNLVRQQSNALAELLKNIVTIVGLKIELKFNEIIESLSKPKNLKKRSNSKSYPYQELLSDCFANKVLKKEKLDIRGKVRLLRQDKSKNKGEEAQMRIYDSNFQNHTPINQAILITCVGDSMLEYGYFKQAQEFYHQSLKIVETLQTDNRSERAYLFMKLGFSYSDDHKFDDAISNFLKSIELIDQIKGENSETASSVYFYLGNCSRAKYDNLSAKNYYEKALNILVNLFGKKHQKSALALEEIGNCLSNLSKIDEALKYHTEALEIISDIYWESHLRVARIYNCFGNDYNEQGKFQEAIKFYKDSLAIRVKICEPDSRELINCYLYIGSCYHSLGQYEKSLRYLQKANEIACLIPKKNELLSAELNSKIGAVYDAKGDLEKAMKHHKMALEIRKRCLGENHHYVGQSYKEIGTTMTNWSNYKEACGYLEKAKTIFANVYQGENHKDIASVEMTLGFAKKGLGLFKIALNHYNNSIKMYHELFGDFHPDLPQVYTAVGLLFEELQQFNQAYNSLKSACEIQKKLYTEKSPEVANTYNHLGNLFYTGQNYPTSLGYLKLALEIFKDVSGEKSSDVAMTYNNMGNTCQQMGKEEDALINYQKALEIYDEIQTMPTREKAISHHNIAKILCNQRKYREAVNHHKKSLEINESFFGMDHIDNSDDHMALGYISIQKDDINTNLKHQRIALQIFKNADEIDQHKLNQVKREILKVMRFNDKSQDEELKKDLF